MSTKPAPLALTSAMLMQRLDRLPRLMDKPGLTHPHVGPDTRMQSCASLASTLHRLAKACQRQAVAECNGEWRDGQRDYIYRVMSADDVRDRLDQLEAEITKAGERLDRKLAALNVQLAPLALEARRDGDPRGTVLRLYSTDAGKPVPCNCGDGESWGVL